MERIFYPRSIVVIGVSDRPDNLGKNIVANLLEFGYKGKIYAFGRTEGQVYGHRIYTSFDQLPEGIDLAVILVPAPLVPHMVDACGRKGIRRVIIESGGFSEYSEERRPLEAELLAIARRWGIRFVGPNCISVVNLDNGLCLPFVQVRRNGVKKGPVSVVAQSGGVAVTYFDLLSSAGLGFNKIISMGNKLDLDEVDYLSYLIEDEGTQIIGLYLESIERGRKLVELARSSPKPILLHKANVHEASAGIAFSHTAALANDDRIVEAAVRQAGMLRVSNFRALVNYAKALSLPPCKGDRLAVLSRSGGHAVVAADAAAEHGFRLLPFPKAFLQRVTSLFRAKVIRPTNPLDLGDLFDFDVYVQIVEECLRLPDFDAVVLIHVYSSYAERENSRRLARKVRKLAFDYDKPVLLCLFSQSEEIASLERTLDYPVYTEIDEAIGALAAARRYHRRRAQGYRAPPRVHGDREEAKRILDKASAEGRPLLTHEALQILRLYGIPVAEGEAVSDPDEAVAVAGRLGYPLAMKLLSPQLIHKSDVGGVLLGIADERALREGYEAMLRRVREAMPEVKVEGVLLQRMVSGGEEVIIGGKRDPSFGPVVMFGLGGIYVEALEEVSFRLAPLAREEAEEMIEELKGSRILKGLRGRPPLDIRSLAEAIVRVGQLLADFPQISSLDVNPFFVFPRGGVAVDARMEIGH